jgi:hypothetical protein
VQRPLTYGPRGWPAEEIPWLDGQVLCQFDPRLRVHVSTREGEAKAVENVIRG